MFENELPRVFQGYSRTLLGVTVPSIPSMHICLDFIPELLTQPDLEKQLFAVDLVSHLAIQYALPKSLSVARLAINTLSTLLGGRFTISLLRFVAARSHRAWRFLGF